MKKERIEITKAKNFLNFYLVYGTERVWLFSQEYSMSVERYFRDGKSLREVSKCNCWKTNPRLAKTIARIPVMVAYVKKDCEIPYKDGKRRYYRTTYRDMFAI